MTDKVYMYRWNEQAGNDANNGQSKERNWPFARQSKVSWELKRSDDRQLQTKFQCSTRKIKRSRIVQIINGTDETSGRDQCQSSRKASDCQCLI